MWNNAASVKYINSHVEPKSLGKCAAYVRRAVEAGGVKIRIPRPRIGNAASACDYGPSFESVGFKAVYTYAGAGPTDTAKIPGQQTGDVVVIQPITGHPHGHIALFNGTHWVSDFIQLRGFYPGQQYRNLKSAYTLYRYAAKTDTSDAESVKNQPIKIVWPIPSNNRGNEFGHQEEILSHIAGESTGLYMIGRNGMWHGGIHITNATTPWCALSGKAASEIIDFPTAYKGEQAVRCMADGEVVAYRICTDYLTVGWESGPLSFSGSFVLVKHYIQPGEKKENGLHFYTLYMHLAPYSAYHIDPKEKKWVVQDNLKAYDPTWQKVAGADNKSASEIYKKGTMPKGAIVEWDKADSNLCTQAFNKREYGLVTFVGLTEDALKKSSKTSLKPGQQYWILVDKNNLSPSTGGVTQPSWWRQLLPPAKESMKFDQVVSTTPWPINAGDSVGHLGYYQAAKDGGYEARYQVHIECISMDDNLEKFLTNPENIGEKSPLYLKYSPGLALFKKDIATETFVKDTKVMSRTGILTLKQVPTEVDKLTKKEYWQLKAENAYILKGQAEPQLLSQYDLEKLGFNTKTTEPSSFNHLDGKTQLVDFLRSAIESIYNAAKGDTRTSHALVKHNYQRILDKINSGATDYSSMEYWRALHNPDYRDIIQKTIVKHPSDWYFSKSDTIWQPFLNALSKEAPEWKKYSEDFLDKIIWMQDVTTEKLGPSVWHMHPIMFLGTLRPVNQQCYCYKQGIVDRPCQLGAQDVTKEDFEKLASQLGVEREVLRAIAVAETGDKVPFKQYVKGEMHATILYERHFMKRLAAAQGIAPEIIKKIESTEPKIIHSYKSGYRYGSDTEQYERLLRAREIDYDSANMSCSWGKFQVMGEYYHHLYESTRELVDAQNYCAIQHLQYFKVFLVKEKKMLQSMKDKKWLSIARKYNGTGQIGYDEKIENAYNSLKKKW